MLRDFSVQHWVEISVYWKGLIRELDCRRLSLIEVSPSWKTEYSKGSGMIASLPQKYVVESMAIMEDRFLLGIEEDITAMEDSL